LVDVDHDKAEEEITLVRKRFSEEKSRRGTADSEALRDFVISGDRIESLDEF